MAIRLDKFLADMSVGTRSEVRKYITKGRVKIAGVIVKKADLKIDEQTIVYLDDEPIQYVIHEYYLLNKPQGYVTATVDQRWPVVMDLIHPIRKDVTPVGRLDKDTEGCLLFTNDGALAHLLLSPKAHVQKVYYAKLEQPLPVDAKERFAQPMEFKEFISQPADFQQVDDHSGYLTIAEGKFHQVKRMFERIGCTVTYLQRVRFGPLDLTDLPLGEYRALTKDEIEKLKAETEQVSLENN